MKSDSGSNSSKRPTPNDVFAIPDAAWPSQAAVVEILAGIVAQQPQAAQPSRATVNTGVETDYFKVMLAIATNAWRARRETLDPHTGEVRPDMLPIAAHIDAIYRDLAGFGISISDHTGEAYEEGQAMKVLNSVPTAGLDRTRVSQTILPSVFWNNRLIQSAEVEIAVPADIINP
jgi:hypothetical protein